jgi:hypothetical protein
VKTLLGFGVKILKALRGLYQGLNKFPLHLDFGHPVKKNDLLLSFAFEVLHLIHEK